MAEPKRPPFRPTLKQVRDIFYILNGDSNEFPREWTDISFLPFLTNIGGKRTSFFDLVCLIMKKRWDLVEKHSENYYNLLLLESSLPCKQQKFEYMLRVNTETLKRMKTQFDGGDIPEKSETPIDEDGNHVELTYRENNENPIIPNNLSILGIDFYGIMNADQLASTFIDLTEDWDRQNIIFERGVGIKFKPGTEREMTDCTTLMALVKQALDEDVAHAKRERRPLTPGHEIRLRVWKEQKGIYDSFKRKIAKKKEEMNKVLGKQLDPESAFGIPVGSSKTKKRKNKKRKTLRYKNKRK